MRLLAVAGLTLAGAACGTQAAAGSGDAMPPAARSGPASAPAPSGASATMRDVAAGLPDPVRVVYVSPSGGGNGKTAEAPAKLERAVDGSKPGDEIQLLAGDYEAKVRVSSGGTSEHPVVIRNRPGDVPRLKGWIHVDDGVPSVWIVGLDVSYPRPPADKGDACIELQGSDVRVINNYIHDCGRNGISAWRPNRSKAPGQLVYGNVIARSDHGVYVQNDYDEEGYKKFVRNLILDSQVGCDRNCFSFHGYTEHGWNSGIWVEESVFRGSRFMLGGTNSRTRHSVVKGNVFYAASPQIAYTSPSQHDEVSGNVVYKSPLTIGYWATDGPSRFTNNELMNAAPGVEINDLRPVGAGEAPAAVMGEKGTSHKTAPQKGAPQAARFHPQDVIDGNTYLADEGGAIRSTWWLPDERKSCCKEKTLADLRADLQASGCANCEAKGKTIAAPVSPRVFLWGNAYEKGRGELAIYRNAAAAGGGTAVPVDLSPVVESGTRYAIVKAADGPASTPVLSGTYEGGTVNVPVTGEFDAFLVLPGTGATP